MQQHKIVYLCGTAPISRVAVIANGRTSAIPLVFYWYALFSLLHTSKFKNLSYLSASDLR
jgi:hypothetical protein